MKRATRALTKIARSETDLANLLGVSTRALRSWTANPHVVTHRTMPEPARRLLLLIDRVPAVMPALLSIALERTIENVENH